MIKTWETINRTYETCLFIYIRLKCSLNLKIYVLEHCYASHFKTYLIAPSNYSSRAQLYILNFYSVIYNRLYQFLNFLKGKIVMTLKKIKLDKFK